MKILASARLTKYVFIVVCLSFVAVGIKVLLPQNRNSLPTISPDTAVTSNNNSCVVTVDSVKYDVTTFRNLHSGGDIFNCGTDMTSIFYQQHNQ